MAQTKINQDGTTRNRMDQLPRAVFGAECLSRQTAKDTTKKPENWETFAQSVDLTTAKDANALAQHRTEWNTLIKKESFTQDPKQQTKHGLPALANPSTDGSRQESWATPSTMDHLNVVRTPQERSPAANKGGCKNLREEVHQWATPTARDHKSGRGNEEREYKELTPMVERTQTGKLNPRWVETLMGLPVGWTMPSCKSPVTIELTSCASSATESCQQQQNEHSELF
jgi:hypothetical protein